MSTAELGDSHRVPAAKPPPRMNRNGYQWFSGLGAALGGQDDDHRPRARTKIRVGGVPSSPHDVIDEGAKY